MRVLQPRASVAETTRWIVATLAWLMVMATGSATVAAADTHGLGNSRTAEQSRVNARIGALFSSAGTAAHYCSASVVDSPVGDMIISAAHCLSTTPGGTVFVPGYRNGSEPYGAWQVAHVIEDPRWTADTDPDHDVAFAVLEPLNGEEIEQVVGANTLAVNRTVTTPVTITGYPQSSDEPITCSNDIARYSSTQWRIACTNYTDGTSGSPWVVAGHGGSTHDEGQVLGVIGGFEQGGYTPDVSYSIYFDDDVAALYRQAVTAVR
ncbi:serine protease [Streptacidiphilus sp. MAP12-16]|uniref:trypsin-like serine peptidase n=1 Tax=Streptacidiphilus sp. MAP12-16 TaxID=3156300 RepID=UPI003519C969